MIQSVKKQLNIKSLTRVCGIILCVCACCLFPVFILSASSSTSVAGWTEENWAQVYINSEYTISLHNATFVTGGKDDGKILTDGKYSSGKAENDNKKPEGWVIIGSSDGKSDYSVTITLDFGFDAKNVSLFWLRAFKFVDIGAEMPQTVKYYVSEDGKNFEYAGNGKTSTDVSGKGAAAIYRLETTNKFTARYMRVIMECEGGKDLYLNEVGAAASGLMFKSGANENEQIKDSQGLIYGIGGNEAYISGFDIVDNSSSSLLDPCKESFNRDDISYTLGKGTGNEVEVFCNFIDENRVNYSGVPNNIQYIVIHNTGTTEEETDAKRYDRVMHITEEESSWHYTVDDKVIYHSLADNIAGWHAGTDKNYESIGIEICTNGAPTTSSGSIVFSGTAYERWVENRFKKSLRNTAVLVAELLTRYGLGTDRVIQHYDATEKNCPLWMRRKGNRYVYEGTLWVEFMSYVEEYYEMFNGNGATPKVKPENQIVVPDYLDYNGEVYPITEIGANAFADTGDFLEKVELGLMVNKIIPGCFEGSDSITEISVKEGNGMFTVENGILYDKNRNEIFDPSDISGIIPSPKENCGLDIREIGGRYYLYFDKIALTLSELAGEYGAREYKGTALDGSVIGKSSEVSTGAVLTLDGAKLYVVRRGDGNGDGKINSLDYAICKRSYLKTYSPIRRQIYALALTDGEQINALDYAMLKRHVLGTYDIYK